MNRRSHVYGPVPSRRFGLSLGVDIVPRKICPYDCVYCQLGRTTQCSIDRVDFFPLDEILADVEAAIARGPEADVITLSGSGEPTLYQSIGNLIRGIRGLSDKPIVLLTNGALLYRDDVADDARMVDILAPSLDAGTPECFRRINRPLQDLEHEQVVRGLATVTSNFTGAVRIEVLLVEGVNDSIDELNSIGRILERVPHETVDINTVVRPALAENVRACDVDILDEALQVFGPKARIIAPFRGSSSARFQSALRVEQTLLDLLDRRPCSLDDMEAALRLHRHELSKALDHLVAEGAVGTQRRGNTLFFSSRSEGSIEM